MGKNRLGTQTNYEDFYKGNGGMRVFKGKRRGGFLGPTLRGLTKFVTKGMKTAFKSKAFKNLTKKIDAKNIAKKMAKKYAPHVLRAGTNYAAKKLKTDPNVLRKNINEAFGMAQKGKGYKRVSYGSSAPKKRKKKVSSIFD